MKSFTFILATIILFLAIEPGVENILHEAETQPGCCSEQCIPDYDSKEKQSEDNDCTDKLCNPFQICSTCVLDCWNLSPNINRKTTYSENKRIIHQFSFTSQFISDFWQPPKII